MIPWEKDAVLTGEKFLKIGLNSVLTCPSDGSADYVSISYVVNGGAGASMLNPSLYQQLSAPNLLGAFDYDNLVRISDFKDGIAQTALLSERLVGGERGSIAPERSNLVGAPPRDLADLGEVDLPLTATNRFLSACAAITNSHPYWIRNHGRHWLFERHYTHAQSPNAPILDCANTISFPLKGIVTARSFHETA
jgi:hypothetical protein